MAVNKDSNGYTFMFAIALVVVVGAGLASISIGLKPFQEKNGQIKKKMDILASINVQEINGSDTLPISRINDEMIYDQYIIEEEVNSGIEEILIITGRNKTSIENHFDKSVELEIELEKKGKDDLLKERLALKGGTAINLLEFNLPRLSVDIDLDYTNNVCVDVMKKDREAIRDRLFKFMDQQGY